jgi:hypothetical protein
MTESWMTVTAADVQAGDRIRLPAGLELHVSRIEPAFFGMPDLLAFIEDSPARWYKQPLPRTAEVEVLRAGDSA